MSKAKNLTGQTIEMLKILERKREPDSKGQMRTYYYCHCNNCGKEQWVRADYITGNLKICDCLYSKQYIDLTNRKFGRLTAIEPTEKRADNGSVIWKCECKCGNIKEIDSNLLLNKNVVSCGCFSNEVHSVIGKNLGALNIKENVVEGTHLKLIKDNSIKKNNSTGYRGVSFDKSRNKYVAQIAFKKKHYHLGRYDTAEEASDAYQEAKKKLHGEFLKWYEEEFKKTNAE